MTEGGPLATVGGPSSQHSEKSYEMIVNLDVIDVYTRKKNENIPKNAKTQQPTENQKNTK